MPSIKMIKRRLASVSTTKKIMKAMNMVAASKLQKNRTRLIDARAFLHETSHVIDNLRHHEKICENVFFTARKVQNAVYLVITGDRGLCGSYNSNIAESAFMHMNQSLTHADTKIISVGLRGYDYMKRHGKEIIRRFDDVLETAFYEDAMSIALFLRDLFLQGDADEVYIAYTHFDSVLTHIPQVIKVLPLDAHTGSVSNVSMKYDPDVTDFFSHAFPMYLSALIYAILLESSACEQAARMVSMDTAEKNAGEIIDKLTRVYNRKRQTSITQEISEVVSGTNVLKAKG